MPRPIRTIAVPLRVQERRASLVLPFRRRGASASGRLDRIWGCIVFLESSQGLPDIFWLTVDLENAAAKVDFRNLLKNSGIVSGHDFSRVVNGAKSARVLAPESRNSASS